MKMFCFEVPAWKRCVQRTMLLKKVFRQSDDNFIAILSRVRLGEMTLKDKADLLKCHFTKKIFDDKIHATKLFPHRISCEQVNNIEVGFPIVIIAKKSRLALFYLLEAEVSPKLDVLNVIIILG